MTPYDATKPEPTALRSKPTRDEAENAVRTLIQWAGDDPEREGLRDTPARVTRAFEEFFAGYHLDAEKLLDRVFEQNENYDDMVMLKDIGLVSHCEHHMVPIIGTATVAYLPERRIVGISKLARIVDLYAKRLQTQEVMTAQIADTIQNILNPQGVAVLVDAVHQCMTTRGVQKHAVSMVTTRFTGAFKNDADLRERFLKQADRKTDL